MLIKPAEKGLKSPVFHGLPPSQAESVSTSRNCKTCQTAWAVWAQHFSQGPVNIQRLKGHEENSSKCLKSFARTLCNVLDKLEIDVLTVSKRQEEPDPWERKNLLSVVENQVHKLIYSS